MAPRPGLVGILLLTGCAGAGASRPAPVLTSVQAEDPITEVLTAAFAADCQLLPADSLWDPDAIVVADGELREGPPRFAGVGPGGQVAITNSRLELRQGLAWVYLEFRWSLLKEGLAREGRATVLLVPGESRPGWKIVHAHSSTVR